MAPLVTKGNERENSTQVTLETKFNAMYFKTSVKIRAIRG
jgi:hypothetical protein